MYLKPFEVRWSDIDANRHLANSAYINFMSHTRMAYFYEKGFSQEVLSAHNIGPVIFYEHVYYLREVLPGSKVRVSLEIKGMSEDGMFFEFHHNFYDPQGKHLSHCEMMGGWINLSTRKLTALDAELLRKFEKSDKAEDFRVLTREDTRRYAIPRKDLV
jgi:acyl-CoA thioester hydrolase